VWKNSSKKKDKKFQVFCTKSENAPNAFFKLKQLENGNGGESDLGWSNEEKAC
jgi:hypothetical protein